MNSPSLLSAQKLRRTFSQGASELEIIKDISLEVKKGDAVCIVGASGSGKSTLLHMLGTLDRPTSGELFFEGQNLLQMEDEVLARFRNQQMGFVFQFHHLLPEFTALENVAIPMLIAGKGKKEAFEKALQLISITGLESRKNHKPAEMSGGEQQRAALARALSNDPKVILADEPTGNLDSNNANAINDLFLKLRDEFGKTFVIVTHNKDLMAIGDNLIEMADGRVVIY